MRDLHVVHQAQTHVVTGNPCTKRINTMLHSFVVMLIAVHGAERDADDQGHNRDRSQRKEGEFNSIITQKFIHCS